MRQERQRLARMYGDPLDDKNEPFYDAITAIMMGRGAHNDQYYTHPPEVLRRFYEETVRELRDTMRQYRVHNPEQWEATARRRDELGEIEDLEKGQTLGFALGRGHSMTSSARANLAQRPDAP